MLFRITAVSPVCQAVKAVGRWTVEADSGEQAFSRLFTVAPPPSDLWPTGSDWTVDPVEQEYRKQA